MNKRKVWKRAEPDSPCQNICLIHPENKICIGCYRTPVEIEHWAKFSKSKRKSLLHELPKRSSLLKTRKGGRNRLNSIRKRNLKN